MYRVVYLSIQHCPSSALPPHPTKMTRPAREQGRDPTSEDQEPTVIESGSGAKLADITEALAVEEIDVNLFRSKVSIALSYHFILGF